MLGKRRRNGLAAIRRIVWRGVELGGVLAIGLFATHCGHDSSPTARVKDFEIAWPNKDQIPVAEQGSTHEITFNPQDGNVFWITGENYDMVVEVGLDGSQVFHPLPQGSGPHGVVFDATGRLFVSLEFAHQVVELDPATGNVIGTRNVNADPHGLGVAQDGVTLWFTGKTTANTVGKIDPDGTVTNYPVPSPNSLPIYIRAGVDGNMWFTELDGNQIGRVTPSGVITQFSIPTPNSRPIALVPDPMGQALWFTEETGNNVGRITPDGTITEFAVPKAQSDVFLTGIAFDSDGNLWVDQYVGANDPDPNAPDHIIRIDKAILTSSPDAPLTTTFFEVPTRRNVLHRLIEGPDGNMWFTGLKSDHVGRVLTQ